MITYNSKIISPSQGKVLDGVLAPEPIILPAYTLRLLLRPGIDVSIRSWKGTFTKVSDEPYIWDVTYENSDWSYMLADVQPCGIFEVIAAGDTSGVTNMDHMFQGCQDLTSIPLFDTSNVTSMNGMFIDCDNLTTIPQFNTSNVTSMASMFYNTSGKGLTSIPMLDTSKVTNTGSMFCGNARLESVPQFDTSNVTFMHGMFQYCHALRFVPFLNISKVTDISRAFQDCFNAATGSLMLYRQAIGQANPPMYHENTFEHCGRDTVTGTAELARIPTSWGGTLVYDHI